MTPHLQLRVAIFQKRLASFRVPIFERLARQPGISLDVLTAEHSAFESAAFTTRALRTVSLSSRGKRVTFQRHVLREAKKYDVVVVEGSIRFFTAVTLVATARLHRIPTVWWTSLYEPRAATVMFPGGLKGLVLKWLLGKAGAVVVYSEYAAKAIRAASPRSCVFVAPNALDTDMLAGIERSWRTDPLRIAAFIQSQNLDAAVVLFVGRLIAAKRVDDLLLAFERASRSRSRLRPVLVIVGDGPERNRLERLADELRIKNDVRFVGEIRDPAAVCPFFLTARVLALPGAGGLALYQALVHGTPVIATYADGTERDLVEEGRTGYLCEPGDPAALSRRIIEFLEMPDGEWLDFSHRCRRRTRQRFDSMLMVSQLRAAIDYAASTTFSDRPASISGLSDPERRTVDFSRS